MKHPVYFGIAARVVLLFAVGMLLTYIPEHLRDFFGDTPCTKNCYNVDADWDWGARHYWYFWMNVVLFFLSFINLIISAASLVKKHYDIKL